MARDDLAITIVGSGGDGVITLGDIIAQVSASEGLNVMKTETYGPQIRGGESSCTIHVSTRPVYEQGAFIDVLLVFSWKDLNCFKGEFNFAPDTVIFYEMSDKINKDELGLANMDELRWVPIPFSEIAREIGNVRAKNMVGLGLLVQKCGFSQKLIKNYLNKKFASKDPEVLTSNQKLFDSGVTYAAEIGNNNLSDIKLQYTPKGRKLLMSGNEASAVGALFAGCRFFAGYPITPSSEILHYFAEWMPKMGGKVLQTEDEMAAIGAAIGGSFAGVKSMTATSGPGLALMTEMLGLATISEIPVVIVNVQRGGPSTGIPTKSEQSDLWQALWGSHGDAPRVVIAPSDVEDCFHTVVVAFNIAEDTQIPVIVLSDQFIGQRVETLSAITLEHEVTGRQVASIGELDDYKRFKYNETGVSPMTWPGMEGGEYQTNGLEHDEYGHPTSMFLIHDKMNEKRYQKLMHIRKKYCFHRRYGTEKADVGIICWGSSKGAVQQAVFRANGRGQKVAAFVPQLLYPFPYHQFRQFLASVNDVIIIELSYSAQFYKYLRTFLKLPEGHTYLYKRSGGKNLTVTEVEEKIQKVLELGYMRKEVLI